MSNRVKDLKYTSSSSSSSVALRFRNLANDGKSSNLQDMEFQWREKSIKGKNGAVRGANLHRVQIMQSV